MSLLRATNTLRAEGPLVAGTRNEKVASCRLQVASFYLAAVRGPLSAVVFSKEPKSWV